MRDYEKAIKELETFKIMAKSESGEMAITMAIEALEQDPKIGRCKDCKHFHELPYHTETLGRCNFHYLRFYPKGDWYCANYEPKESEDKE